jgi:hypothetical protein
MNYVNFQSLCNLAFVHPGHPFRGAILQDSGGDAFAVQMKDVTPEGLIDWAGTVRTKLGGRKAPEWLQGGDLLVLARGSRFVAVCLDEPPAPSVCGPVFFHLRVRRQDVDPTFLAWQINQPPCQRQLMQGAAGSQQLSISRPVLETLQVAMPSMAQQKALAGVARLAAQERQALQQLIQNRERQAHALAEDLYRAAAQAHTQDPT